MLISQNVVRQSYIPSPHLCSFSTWHINNSCLTRFFHSQRGWVTCSTLGVLNWYIHNTELNMEPLSSANTARKIKSTLNAVCKWEIQCQCTGLFADLSVHRVPSSLLNDGVVWYFKCINVLYIGVNVAWKTNPSCVPQVCKFGRYVILMSGCLFVRSVMHLMCFCNLLVFRLFCFLYFCFVLLFFFLSENPDFCY